MDNTIHHPNIRVKKNVCTLFGSRQIRNSGVTQKNAKGGNRPGAESWNGMSRGVIAANPRTSGGMFKETCGKGFDKSRYATSLFLTPDKLGAQFIRLLSLILSVVSNAFPMFLCHCRSCLRVGVQPVQNQGLDHPLWIGKVLCAVLFKCVKYLCVEAVSSLDRLRVLFRFGSRFAFSHNG